MSDLITRMPKPAYDDLKDVMEQEKPASCTYTRPHAPCSGHATHFCMATLETPIVWSVEATAWHLATLNGFTLTSRHTQEFCETAAALVCAARNAKATP